MLGFNGGNFKTFGFLLKNLPFLRAKLQWSLWRLTVFGVTYLMLRINLRFPDPDEIAKFPRHQGPALREREEAPRSPASTLVCMYYLTRAGLKVIF